MNLLPPVWRSVFGSLFKKITIGVILERWVGVWLFFKSISCLSVSSHYPSFACYFSFMYMFTLKKLFHIKYFVLPYSIDVVSTLSYQMGYRYWFQKFSVCCVILCVVMICSHLCHYNSWRFLGRDTSWGGYKCHRAVNKCLVMPWICI